MKITANAGELADALALAAILGEDKRLRNLRSLEAVSLVTDVTVMKIGGNVLDFAVSIAVPADIETLGALAVSGQRLAALAAGFPRDAKIQIADDGAAARVTCGRSRFQLPVIPQDELPAAPAIGEETGRTELVREEALTLFERPFFAMGTEQTRFYLCGVLLRDSDGALAAVATDGHRLCKAIIPGGGGLSQDDRLIVPRPAVKIILKLLADKSNERIVLRRSATLLAVEAAGFSFTSKLIDTTYPDYARIVGTAVRDGAADLGVLICGSGAGVAIAANKLRGVRAALCHDLFTARQSREDDDANVLCLGAEVVTVETAIALTRAFVAARFSGAERHVRRLAKIRAMEEDEQSVEAITPVADRRARLRTKPA